MRLVANTASTQGAERLPLDPTAASPIPDLLTTPVDPTGSTPPPGWVPITDRLRQAGIPTHSSQIIVRDDSPTHHTLITALAEIGQLEAEAILPNFYVGYPAARILAATSLMRMNLLDPNALPAPPGIEDRGGGGLMHRLAQFGQESPDQPSGISGQPLAEHWAGSMRLADRLALLKTCLPDIHQADENGNTPLHVAARWHNATTARALAAAGAPLDAPNNAGHTALHLAATSGSAKVVRTLIDLGANHAIPDKQGRPALHLALRHASADVIGILFKHSPDLRDRFDENALQHATRDAPQQALRTLIDLGAPLDATTSLGKTALHLAAENRNISAAKMLLDAGARPDMQSAAGWTPLHYACEQDDPKIVRALIAANANIALADYEGKTPLHVAAEYDSHACLRLLPRNAASLGARDAMGRTPLHLASGAASSQTVAALLSAGADVLARCHRDRTPLMSACATNTERVVRGLIAAGGDVSATDNITANAFHFAAGGAGDAAAIFSVLLAAGCDPTSADDFDQTPLHRAFESHDQTNVAALIAECAKAGITLDLNAADIDGDTPLHLAAELSNRELVAHLLQLGADPSVRNDADDTPLHVLATFPDAETPAAARCLLLAGADLGARNQRGHTPLLHAASEGATPLFEAILTTAAEHHLPLDIHARDNRGFDAATLLQLALS